MKDIPFVAPTGDILDTYKINLDKVDGITTYIGYANPNILGSQAYWRIKLVTTAGEDFFITWADGNVLFDNIWDNRASLIYS